ncbi:hypothetical protein NVP1087A_03 [Vibrio phage 1.087.A._10N.261.45.F9]|nr:hypothetical protein NVP1087A_03 [Vibrio phage 1.087.A._10N.261.45.F9]
MRKKTTQEFISDAIKVHGDRYDYSLVEYKNSQSKVTIVCQKHGEFMQSPTKHSRGQGCKRCACELTNSARKPSADQFSENANKIHNDKYDYSKSIYVNAITKLTIICPDHGEFEQVPNSHLSGSGCPECKRKTLYNLKVSDIDDVIKGFESAHGAGTYNYEDVKYVNSMTKVEIICPKHGSFMQEPANHAKGVGCPSCASYGFSYEKPACVYVLRSSGLDLIKVGITNNIKIRTSHLRNSTPFDFEVVEIRKFNKGIDAFNCEKSIHKMLDSANFKGFDGATEWFKYDGRIADILTEWKSI